MPRAGSPPMPPGGITPPAPMDIGEAASPPFAVLPDPATLFERRSQRLVGLAPGHELEAYLRFLADLTAVQHRLQATLPPPALPDPAQLDQAYQNGMPPISIGHFQFDDNAAATLEALLAGLEGVAMPSASKAALATLMGASRQARAAIVDAVLDGTVPEDAIAAHVLAAAALQVQFTRLAARLDASRLTPVADGVCPACGSTPVASLIVGWPRASGTRFCCCSLCATLWHVVRIRCLRCGGDKGVAYHSVEGGSDTIKAETCEECRSYVKILHQHRDVALEPLADDVASLGLDLLLRQEGFVRASANPFLMGY